MGTSRCAGCGSIRRTSAPRPRWCTRSPWPTGPGLREHRDSWLLPAGRCPGRPRCGRVAGHLTLGPGQRGDVAPRPSARRARPIAHPIVPTILPSCWPTPAASASDSELRPRGPSRRMARGPAPGCARGRGAWSRSPRGKRRCHTRWRSGPASATGRAGRPGSRRQTWPLLDVHGQLTGASRMREPDEVRAFCTDSR